MKRGQVAALLAGAALGLAGVGIAIALSREEGRQAARRVMDKTAPYAQQARETSARLAKTAVQQYQTTAPKAAEVIGNVMAQAQPAAGAITAKLPRVSLNGKAQPAEVIP